MTSSVDIAPNGVILNACCVMSLYASGQMTSVLKALPGPIMITRYVLEQEVLRVYRATEESEAVPDEQIELAPFISAGLISSAPLASEEELKYFVELAKALGDDGEAWSGALAIQRGWALGIDDPRSSAIFNKIAPDLHVLSTPVFLHYWVDRTRPPPEMVRMALQNVERRAEYSPLPHHPLYTWWQGCISQQE